MVEEIIEKVRIEEEMQSKEAGTSETDLMNELLNQMKNDTQEEQEIPKLGDDVKIVADVPSKPKPAMKFVCYLIPHHFIFII